MYLVHHLIKSDYYVVEVPYVLGSRRSGESKTTDGYISMFAKGTKYLYALMRLRLLGR